jgi:simple sugar transport system ATP-binding protein
LVLTFSVQDNLVLNTYYEPPFTKGWNLQEKEIRKVSKERVDQFDIRTPNVSTPVSSLSGGNQQKVIVAREFSRPIKLLIASQPTRGLDVGSIEYIHNQIIHKRDQGCAILLISPELDEIISLSDRIAVMFAGKIMAIIPTESATREKLGLLMTGIVNQE